jgi:hypothetical protein
MLRHALPCGLLVLVAMKVSSTVEIEGSAGLLQDTVPAFAAFRSQGKRLPSGSQRAATQEDPASKRSKAAGAEPDPSSTTADSSVTLAHGIADVLTSGTEVTLATLTLCSADPQQSCLPICISHGQWAPHIFCLFECHCQRSLLHWENEH